MIRFGMIRIGSPAFVPFLALLAAIPLSARDTIHKVDGEQLTGVEIVEERLDQVVYKKDGREANVSADEVLRVTFAAASFPKKLAEAVAALSDDDPLTALEEFDFYVTDELAKPREKKKWAPAHAAWQTVELAHQLGDHGTVVADAGRLIRSFPESRYAPHAFVAKADAELDGGDAAAAAKTLTGFETFIAEHGLSDRWKLTREWMGVVVDSVPKPDAKRRALRDIVLRAAAFPLVATRAKVAEGETFIAEADEKADPAAAQELRKQAQAIFEQALSVPADKGALAAAYAGIGESLFYDGAAKDDDKVLLSAADHFLRVIVLYPGESRYVPKSYFFAMRSYELMGERKRSREMRANLNRLFPDSRWSVEAAKFK